jgi:N-acetylneuraminic acid mutarotase
MFIYTLENQSAQSFKLAGESIPKLRIGFKGAVINNKYYFFGGKYLENTHISEMYYLDLSNNTWYLIPETQIENKIEHTLSVTDKYLVLFAGYNTSHIYNDIKLFDLEANTWISIFSIAQSPKHRYGHAAVIYKG